MIKFWTTCYEAMRFGYEAQAVISARLMLFAIGDARAAAEAYRMVTEKAIAFADAQSAAKRALDEGRDLYEAAELAYAPVRESVHENSRRLFSTAH